MKSAQSEIVEESSDGSSRAVVPPIPSGPRRIDVLLNEHRFINKFLEDLNAGLEEGDDILIRFESAEQREERRYGSIRPDFLRRAIVLVDFVYHRAWPKLLTTRKLYFFLTGGKYRVMTYTEVLGRLISCSFTIEETRRVDGVWEVEASKSGRPGFPSNPTYGLFVSLNRIGKNGKRFKVYKIRTMSPFSEYVQQYIHEKNGTGEGGKIASDFRITPWGRFLRRFWLDELPMLWNWLKRDLKFVGVRPVSSQRFDMFPPELQEMRSRNKPGLLPAFYADAPDTFEETVSSELRYLKAYEESPIMTDLRYLGRIIPKILARKVGTQ